MGLARRGAQATITRAAPATPSGVHVSASRPAFTPAPAAGVTPPSPPPPAPEAAPAPAVHAPPPAVDPDAKRTVAAGDGRMLAAAWNARAAAAPPAAGARDVSQVTPADLAAMARSRDPMERRLGQTIARAQTAYAGTINGGGRVLVGTSAGNGGYPVVTIVPPGFDPSRPARVQTHYHGWNATVADPRGHGAGATARIADVQAQDPQAIFVLPECRNAPARGGAVQTDWSNVSSQARTTEDALRDAGITSVGTRVVSAHSGGGAALSYAIQRSRDGSGLAADRLELHDSLYGSQADVARWSRTANGAAVQEVRYFHGTNDTRADAALPGAFAGRYRRADVPHPRAVPTLTDDRGRTVPRYNADAHNRTIAENLGSRG